MWKETIQSSWSDAEFYPPASQDEIGAAEAQLGLAFPEDLRSLLSETDGMSADSGASFVYRVSPEAEYYDTFVYQNETMKSDEDFARLYASFDNLFFIGSDGGGDPFGYELDGGKCTANVICWDHENDSRVVVSTTGLRGYLEYVASLYSDEEE